MSEEVPETIDDLIAEVRADAKYRSILEIWRAVLAPAEAESRSKITPQWANRICVTYRGIEFADMGMFRDVYFEIVAELDGILKEEISTDDECLNVMDAAEDADKNSAHYLNVLFNWQKAMLQRELDWDYLSPGAAVELGVLSEIHKMFFEKTGLTGLLDEINFEFTDSDRDLLASELEAMKSTQEG